MTYIELIITFFKIGSLSFGGGYAMIPFFEKEIGLHNWTSMADYSKVIALAQIIPGPFAIDSSAYIGYKAAGLLGAVIASIALSLPSFLALVIISKFYMQFKSNPYIQLALTGVRPVVIGVLMSAAYIIGVSPLTATSLSVGLIVKSLVLVVSGFLLLKYTKINPIVFIVLFGFIGLVLF